MFARLLALVCLVHVGLPAWGMNLGEVSVGIRLKTSLDQSPFSVREMKTELERLMRSQGVQISWWDPTNAPGPERVVVLELRGVCDAGNAIPDGPPVTDRTALASSAVESGEILPFSWIHCDALARFIGRSVADLPHTQGNYLYGRAMARLAAHELYHILSGTLAHEETGIAKAHFTSADLLASEMSFQESVPAPAPEPTVAEYTTPRAGFEDSFGK